MPVAGIITPTARSLRIWARGPTWVSFLTTVEPGPCHGAVRHCVRTRSGPASRPARHRRELADVRTRLRCPVRTASRCTRQSYTVDGLIAATGAASCGDSRSHRQSRLTGFFGHVIGLPPVYLSWRMMFAGSRRGRRGVGRDERGREGAGHGCGHGGTGASPTQIFTSMAVRYMTATPDPAPARTGAVSSLARLPSPALLRVAATSTMT